MKSQTLQRDPYVAAVDQIGDAWTFLITREAFFGAKRFEDFCSALQVSRARLSERLSHLVDTEMFEKRLYSDTPPRYEYHFTDKGLAIYQIALSLIEWGNKWRPVHGAPSLIHVPCGAPLKPVLTCRACAGPVTHESVQWPGVVPLNAVLLDDPITTANVRRWRKMSSLDVSGRLDPAVEALKAIGDRWSMLIMYGAQQTDFRFREAQAKLGLAHNILSNRLKSLVGQGLLERSNDTRQAPYRATPAGLDQLDSVLVTRTWAMDWIKPGKGAWSSLTHADCGNELLVTYTCANCNGEVAPYNVTYG